MNRYHWVVSIVVLLMLSNAVYAASALKTVEEQVNQLIAVLGDESLTGSEGEAVKKDAIRKISDRLFDFTVMSRFTLGRNWKALSPEQQKEFVTLYRRLLEKVYMDRLLDYQNEKVVFEEEKQLSDTRAEVQTHILASKGKIPIHYRMVKVEEQWRVYDLIIENISLVKNYRGQFDNLLNKQSPAEMLDQLRQKTASDA